MYRLLSAVVLGLWSLSVPAVEVPATVDLAADGAAARRAGVPVMLMFSATYCGYCDLLEAEILRPMLISGDYDDKVVIRKLVLDEADEVRGFDGRMVSPDWLMGEYDVYVTPTLVFLSPEGRVLAGNIVGVNTLELFGGRVDAAIAEARARIAGAGIAASR